MNHAIIPIGIQINKALKALKGSSIFIFLIYLVPQRGFEPPRPQGSTDFKSVSATNYDTGAYNNTFKCYYFLILILL